MKIIREREEGKRVLLKVGRKDERKCMVVNLAERGIGKSYRIINLPKGKSEKSLNLPILPAKTIKRR